MFCRTDFLLDIQEPNCVFNHCIFNFVVYLLICSETGRSVYLLAEKIMHAKHIKIQLIVREKETKRAKNHAPEYH